MGLACEIQSERRTLRDGTRGGARPAVIVVEDGGAPPFHHRRNQMSSQPNPAAPESQPTPQQTVEMAQAGGVAAGEAVERGATPDEVRKIVADAMAANARANRVSVDDDTIQQIAHATIAQLEQAGAFEPPPAPPAGGAPHPGAAAAVPVDPAAGDPAAAAGAPVVAGESPRKQTFADKFFGHKPR